MGEQTLRYYLKAISLILIIFFILLSLYIFFIFNKNLVLKNNQININKGENLEYVLKNNILNISNFDIKIIKFCFKVHSLISDYYFHYGDFNILSNSSLIDFIKIISKPSNILIKITIIEGWSQNQLDLELSKHFQNYNSIPYNNIIADTYFIEKNTDFYLFLETLKTNKINYFMQYKNNELFKKFNENELMIIGSLLEKEGLDMQDKKIISSVIFNRLRKNMKLQLDATVLYAVTNGNYDLGRKLLISDLKINHPFNTYVHTGLPPMPISYVGKETLNILFENYNSDFMFYFFNYSLKRHIFSKTFKEHKDKLNEYRKDQ